MIGIKNAPRSDRLTQGLKAKKDEFLCTDDYITSTDFFEGWARWQTEAPALELRRAAR